MTQRRILTGILLIVVLFALYVVARRQEIHSTSGSESNRLNRQAAVTEEQPVHPLVLCTSVFTPFPEPARSDFSSIRRRVIGRYGDYRRSHRVGHKHAGIDLKGAFSEGVYPIGIGQVIEIFRSFPNKAIVIKHVLPDSSTTFSVYTHVEDISVDIGDWVSERTQIARLFTEEELQRADFGTSNHLHFEIRKSYDDHGRASWQSMTAEELDRYCQDPLEFFRAHLSR